MDARRPWFDRRARRRFAAAALALGLSAPVRASVDLGAFVRRGLESRALPRSFGARLSLITEVPAGFTPPAGFSPVGGTSSGGELGVVEVSSSGLPALVAGHPELRFEWSPPFRALLDRADGWVHASSFRNTTGLDGRGVVVGIVDTGIDPTHPDLRGEGGASRILYWLDFSRQRAELHPELEDEVGCGTDPESDERTPCAVFDGDDVTALLENGDPGDDPHDPDGHGTHVASLAVSSGSSQIPPRYVGVAPGASLVVVRVVRRDGGIYDADVLKAARFVFDRAAELGMPAVVNLSLGSDFGAHDGRAPIERGLESLVGPEHPGRAIVVAAGNSAGLYEGLDTGAPEPLGIHTEVHVPGGASALVPIITPVSPTGATEGAIYVWIGTRPGDALAVGVEDTAGTLLEPVPLGAQAVEERGELEVVVINDAGAALSPVPEGSSGAVVMFDGRFASGEAFGLRLEGPASASIWVQGEGGFHPQRSLGPLLPRALKDGTINVPASSPALIAVGATLNRNEWVDVAGETVAFEAHGALDTAPLDTTAYFSSAGPNALGTLKPDLVAPGAFVVGAMADGSDPRERGSSGMFADPGACAAAGLSEACLVTDDFHGVSAGTSMAAPLVTGAIALLFGRDPELDQLELRSLLQAGARPLEGAVFDEQQVGAGGLDLERTLDALGEQAG
ncbi:MAG TPA: S8 family serine peptidase, partial [Polyangiaceae bacterium]